MKIKRKNTHTQSAKIQIYCGANGEYISRNKAQTEKNQQKNAENKKPAN